MTENKAQNENTKEPDPRLGEGQANMELLAYLKSKPAIRPLRDTFFDAAFGYNVLSGLTASMGVLSGLYGGNTTNHYRITGAAIACTSYLVSAAALYVGRYQAYCDLRDFQSGVDPNIIMARDDSRRIPNRILNFGLNHIVKITAAVGIVTSSLAIAAGVTSNRWGEVASGVLGIPSYIIRLLPYQTVANVLSKFNKSDKPEDREKKGFLAKAFSKALATTEPVSRVISLTLDLLPEKARLDKYLRGKLKKITEKPLLLSSFLSASKRTPGFIGACIAADPYQIGQFGLGYVGDAMIPDMEMRGLGRRFSIIDKNVTPDGLDIAENMMGKKYFHGVKKLMRGDVPQAPATTAPQP